MANLSSGCRKGGRCSCLHYYDDGRPVKGSGTADDPYIHERAAVRSIQTYSGTTLLPDLDGNVTLPRHVTGLVLDGREIQPDLTGRIILPSSISINLSSFNLRDSEYKTVKVYEGSTVDFQMDGASGIGMLEKEMPVVVGRNIVFPQLKSREYRVNFNQTQIGTPAAGGVLLNNALGSSALLATMDLRSQKQTQFMLYLSIAIQENSASIVPQNGEHINFRPQLVPVAGQGIEVQSLPALTWSPDFGYGHRRYSLSSSVRTVSPNQQVADLELRLEKLSQNNVDPARDIRCEFQAYLVSI